MPIFFEWDSCFLYTSPASQREGVRNVIPEWSLRQIRGGSHSEGGGYIGLSLVSGFKEPYNSTFVSVSPAASAFM